MPDGIRWVGLDVRARGSTIAVFDQTTGELNARRVTGRPHELVDPLLDVPRPARMVYEAGPTGYRLARRARALGIEMAVCAPGRTERRPGDRVKTDQRDAARLNESCSRSRSNSETDCPTNHQPRLHRKTDTLAGSQRAPVTNS